MSKIIRLAVQKSGRLSEDSLNLIKECGIKYHKSTNKLTSNSYNFPLEFLFLRDDDIPGYVEDGVADIGIVGENVLLETVKDVNVIEKLGFSKCRLSLAVSKTDTYNSLEDLNGKSIATSYPVILGEYLKKHGINASIHQISGSVEIAPNIGLAEAICDLVSSGSTLISNGLKEVEVVMKSEAVMIGYKKLDPDKQEIINQLQFRIQSVQKASNNKYILLNAPNKSLDQIIKMLPGMKSPTVVPLAMEGWSSVHTVVKENDFWEIIEKLRLAGAQGILVLPIEKMIL